MSSDLATTADQRAQQAALMALLKAKGPPYPSQNAAIGGLPDIKHDVPASAILIAIFACLAATHMTIFQVNRRRGILFIPSGVTFGFCMARITTFVMRVVWAKNPTNAGVAIAASIFVGAGVLLLMIVNMLYAQRVLRGYHPKFGHKKVTNMVFAAWYGSIVGTLVMFVVTGVYTMYTLDKSALLKCRDVQRFCIIWLLVFTFAPIPIVLAARFVPSSTEKAKFGTPDRLIHKVFIVLAAAILLTIETVFRTVVTFSPPRPRNNPAWYHKRAAFYTFLPMLEIMVVILYAASRVDRRFYIPKTLKEDGKGHQMVDEETEGETMAEIETK